MTPQGAAVLVLPRAWAASGVAAGSHPTIHARVWAGHGFHRAAAVDVGTWQGKKKSKPKQCRGMAGTNGQVTSSKDLSSGEKRKIVSYREEAAQTREKEKEREEQKQATERETDRQRKRWREREKERKDRRRVHERESRKEQEGQGRLVARPFMARTRRGRQGVSPGT